MGCRRDETPRERRRDRRLSPPGRVRVRTEQATAEVEGRIVDISAGGVRLLVLGRLPFRPGQTVDVEVRIGAATDTVPPPVRLCGHGFVTRVGASADGVPEAAVCFEAPLAVEDLFPAVNIY